MTAETFTVELAPGGQTFDVAAGETILDAALRQGIDMLYGCRQGRCSTCKYLVEDGDVDLGNASTYSLPDAERDQGWALLCCATPETDLLIRDHREPDARALPVLRPDEFGATVQAVIQLTAELWELVLAPSAPLTFYAGQFVELGVEGDDGLTWRSYSMASAPAAADTLRFVIKQLPGGVFSGQLSRLAPGATLRVRGPFGASYLRAGQRPVLMAAIGSGLAPVLSMLRDAAGRGDPRAFTLYYGARRPEDLPYLDELGETLARQLQGGFRFVPCLDGVTEADGWTGTTGTVTRAIQHEVDNASNLDVYLCGAPPMCEAVGRLLAAKGLPDLQLYFDRFFPATPAR